jgi:hypothetical protein
MEKVTMASKPTANEVRNAIESASEATERLFLACTRAMALATTAKLCRAADWREEHLNIRGSLTAASAALALPLFAKLEPLVQSHLGVLARAKDLVEFIEGALRPMAAKDWENKSRVGKKLQAAVAANGLKAFPPKISRQLLLDLRTERIELLRFCIDLQNQTALEELTAALRDRHSEAQAQQLTERLRFEASTFTVYLDNQVFQSVDPVAFKLLETLSQYTLQTKLPLNGEKLQHLAGCRGKKINREFDKLPPALRDLINGADGTGRWVLLPLLPKSP